MLKEAFITSWKNLRLTIIWPIILNALSSLLFSYLFLETSGVLDFVLSQNLPGGQDFLFNAGLELVNFLRNNDIQVIVTFTIFFIVHFVIGSSLTAIKFGVITDILKGKKQGAFKGFWKALHYGNDRFWPVIWIRALTYAFGFLVAIIAFGLLRLLKLPSIASSIIIGVIIIIIALLLYFRFAILFLGKKGPIVSIFNSVKLLFKKPKLVIGVFLIVVAMNFIRYLLGLIPQKGVLIIIMGLIITIYTLLLVMWQDLFLFTAFKLQKKKSR